MPDVTLQFLGGALVGAAASIAANAVWAVVTAPKLVILPPERTSIEGAAHFWGARVRMAEANAFPRHPALAVEATLQVQDPVTRALVATFICRWQGTPQPIVPVAPNQYVPTIAGIPSGQRGDVYQHKPTAIDLFIKFDGDPAFYGFPTEAYFHQLRHPHFTFAGSAYDALLAVRHDQDEHLITLRVDNPSANAADFRVTVRDHRYRSMFGHEFGPPAA